MTQDEIIEMARQAGFWKDLFAYPEFKEHVETFAKLVEDFATAKERDRMCKQCNWSKHENATCNEANQSKIFGKG
jgi:phenylalanine-4-hydroxylase